MSGYSYGAISIWRRLEVIEALRDAVGRGLTFGETAKELSALFGVEISRNSVIGKCSRLGLKSATAPRTITCRTKGSDKDIPLSIVQRSKPELIKIALAAPEPPVEPPSGAGLTLMALKRHDCRFPIGVDEDGTHRFCSAYVSDETLDRGRRYCAWHLQLSYRPAGQINLRSVKQANSTRAGIMDDK